jgi:hypothetical protein
MTNATGKPWKIKFAPWAMWVTGAGLLGALSLVVFFSLKKGNGGWQPAMTRVGNDVVSAVVVGHVRSLKYIHLTKIQASTRALVLSPENAPSVVIYDFAAKDFCGQGGCLFPVYEQKSGKLVADFLLFQNLPPGVELFGSKDSCFYLNQLSGARIATINYCYSGNAYAQTSTQFNQLP